MPEPIVEPVAPVVAPVATPVATPAAEPTSIVNPDGSFAEKWSEKYGADNQAHLSRYKDIDSLVKSHIDTKKKFGKNPDSLVEIPTDTSSDEVKAAWRKAHNAPATKADYKYALSDDMAIKLGPVDEKKLDAFRDYAYGKNWSNADFQDALDFYHNNMLMDVDSAGNILAEHQNAAAEATRTELKKEWLDGYDDRVQRAQQVMEKYGGVDAVSEANLQNSPNFIKFLDNIASAMSEDTLKGVTNNIAPTASNIKSQINDLRIEMDKIAKESPVNYKASAKYKELTERKHELYKLSPA